MIPVGNPIILGVRYTIGDGFTPPHCDTLSGPVVQAAKRALETGNVNLILPWVPETAESELRKAFEKAYGIRRLGGEASSLADYWFFETAVRLHRTGEGAPYTGLKPAGLDEGPVVPRAERALELGDAAEVTEFLSQTIQEELRHRLEHALSLKDYSKNDVKAARDYVEAMLGFILYSHGLYTYMKNSGQHGAEASDAHSH